MIGNDIVDLKQAAKDSPDSYREGKRHQRFLEKVFTEKEQGYIFTAKNTHQIVWLLWSMKESAYKINIQQYQQRFFNPKKIECTLLDNEKGSVKINNECYSTLSTISNKFIYTVAALKNIDKSQGKYFKIDDSSYKDQHQTCNAKLKEAISQLYKTKNESVSIKKNKLGVPKLYKNRMPIETSCSITHHGNYGAYAII
jgi:phosphopantetheinyl transferase (holo-ACP synthase)